ncbi:Os02g0563400 [Oryza sativa Japonica Group]|jgi:hypothetical protein|uniref:Os02g0563400 protein n=1 Tax=Oryza sativa subsp. japonica TaxID=39947 RepID=A0A0P0VKE2_ORYSJ|nr:Os02g0563400 [Oryza sativa Japonica Group]
MSPASSGPAPSATSSSPSSPSWESVSWRSASNLFTVPTKRRIFLSTRFEGTRRPRLRSRSVAVGGDDEDDEEDVAARCFLLAGYALLTSRCFDPTKEPSASSPAVGRDRLGLGDERTATSSRDSREGLAPDRDPDPLHPEAVADGGELPPRRTPPLSCAAGGGDGEPRRCMTLSMNIQSVG